MLTIQRRVPVTHDVLGAQFTFAPVDVAMWRAARLAGAKARGGEDVDTDSDDVASDIRVAVGCELVRRGLTGWSDVVDGGTGEPLVFSADARDDLLADPLVLEALDGAYVVPFLLRLAEKNGSSPSPSGTGAGATPGKPIAAPRATRGKRDAAKTAPTPKTNR